jgi:transcriptional regulator with GAF, ATPase, and Fis domain
MDAAMNAAVMVLAIVVVGTDADVQSRMLGDSPSMKNVAAMLRGVCDRTGGGVAPTVLLTGETGKGLVAKTIHDSGQRRNRTFANCAAISANLLESELFGHEKGAFTDARSTRVGLLETGDGGTEKKLRRVGGNQPIHVDVQIVAATHADLAAMVKRNVIAVRELRNELKMYGFQISTHPGVDAEEER